MVPGRVEILKGSRCRTATIHLSLHVAVYPVVYSMPTGGWGGWSQGSASFVQCAGVDKHMVSVCLRKRTP